MTITNQMCYHLAKQIKKSAKEGVQKGYILFYPEQIDLQPLSTNFLYVSESYYKTGVLSEKYIEVLQIEPQLSLKDTLKELQYNLLCILNSMED